jgi:ABC-type multidrug transport system fused ATPase/permease subunit
MYSFRFFRSVHSQRSQLLAASEYADVQLNPLLAEILNSLGERQSHQAQRFTRRRIWLDSICSVKPLLVRSALWQSVSTLGMVTSLLAARYILSPDSPNMLIISLCFAYLLAECARHCVFFFDMQRRAQIARGVQLFLFDRINKKLLTLDRHSNAEFSTGNVKTLLSGDVEAVEDFITTALGSWIPAFLVLAITSGPIIGLAGVMGLIGVVVALLQVPIALSIVFLLERYKDLRQTEQDKFTTIIGEWVKNVRLVRYLNWESAIARRVEQALRRFSIAASKSHFLVCLAFGVSYSWWAMPILGMLVYGSYTAAPLSPSEFFPVVWLLSLLSNQIQFLPHSLTQYGEAAAAISRLERFFNLPEISRHFTSDLAPLEGNLGMPIRVHLRGVTVSYPAGDAICNLSLSVDLTSRFAIVGEVGSGKTTLLELLLGELAPTSGEIEVEFSSGVRAPLWTPEVYSAYRSSIAYAPQEPFLSNATLRENIDLLTTRDIEQVKSAAEQACLTPDIALFTRGLEEEVGETGINLSGGQKQRVSLARAFVSGRPIFFLDDPLSAVDTATERSLFSRFVTGARGFILVSHRIAELAGCDRVIVLQRGEIVEDGAPNNLLARPTSRYREFIEACRQQEEHDVA